MTEGGLGRALADEGHESEAARDSRRLVANNSAILEQEEIVSKSGNWDRAGFRTKIVPGYHQMSGSRVSAASH